ncbi:FAD-dependent oxidoreductase [Paenibacillus qinlingensis]|uniref:Choline dehydrogenase-like flavoprotein n=1 Tax=Paenibacillus qinlingensis TaxID=1837343 RepID=A0ABU1NTH6_9BACL|nr:FAD-dependent oxidoreductase [Paenibacillus qinlingensis]MDR6550786.1 choline dehydrogenase-like flavoprotein [Paenibacillus qinlingensis]
MKQTNEHYDVVVCGGGLAGFCAGVAAARQGAKACIIQDRPVFGGNSSSEIRVTPHGAAAFHAYARETGILSELLIEERARNHEEILENGWTNSVWDMVMYDMAMHTPNLTFHLNTSIQHVITDGNKNIQSVIGRIANGETEITISGSVFIDCTGDGIVADLAGCEWRMGSEGREEFNEPHAPLIASQDTMGNSIHFKAKDMGRPVPFKAPDWAVKYDDASFFYKQGRTPYDVRGGYWWLEIGIPWHTIYDTENIRHELTRHTLGVWDWIKNKDPETMELAANYAIDWIGQVPGKRESRRIIGDYFMTEHDILNRKVFEDEIAFGGWFIDLHTPGGLLAPTSEPNSAAGYQGDYDVKSYCGPYGVPLSICIAKDMNNLMMAGRNVSVTHAALGTVRVMGTTALMGQAVGTAAGLAVSKNVTIRTISNEHIHELKQTLVKDGCFLPNNRNEDELDLARSAQLTASSEAVVHGVGPESRDSETPLLKRWWDTAPKKLELNVVKKPEVQLVTKLGQWIAMGTSELRKVSVCLTNTSDQQQIVHASLIPVNDIWDYRVNTGTVLASTELSVAPGEVQWIEWGVQLTNLQPNSYIRLDLSSNEHVIWHRAGGIEPGQTSAWDMGNGQMRGVKYALSYRVEPAQPSYGAVNVISGVKRPQQSTNLWKSDPQQPLSQWLQLAWEQAVTIREVHLAFPGQLLTEYHYYPPFYKDPQCPSVYTIQAWRDDRWEDLVHVKDNYQRQMKHNLSESVKTDKLRIIVHATNGDPSAAIYEVRCY